MKKILFQVLVFTLMLLLNSCDSITSSSDDKTTIIGKVKLIDLDGNETVSDEVIVTVFEKDENDISWDYRLNKPVLVTNTDSDGSFSYKAKDNNNYLVVFLKEGYSIKEFKQNSLSDVINLFENIEINGAVTSPIELNGTSDLVITNDVVFIDNGSLSIVNCSKIRIESGKRVTFYNDISFMNEVLITSNDKVYSFNNDQIAEFTSFEISPSATIINNLIEKVRCSFSNYGFVVEKDNIEIRDCIFSNSSNGLYVVNSDGHVLTNIYAQNITDPSNGGIYLDKVNNTSISRCELKDNYNGIKVSEVRNIDINNCNFENNNRGFLSYQTLGCITNNFFNNNMYCLELFGNSRTGVLSIEYNIFKGADIGIYQHNTGSFYHFNTMLINNNNFINNFKFVTYNSATISNDLDATNNYFDGLNNEISILEKIMDTSSVEEFFIDVLVVPFKTSPISTAGILQD